MKPTPIPAPPRGVDGRSALARRYRRLVAAFSRDLGDDLTEADRALVASAAMAALRIDALRAHVLSGAVVDDDQLTRLLNSTTRILTAVSGRSRRQNKRSLTIDEYLKGGAST